MQTRFVWRIVLPLDSSKYISPGLSCNPFIFHHGSIYRSFSDIAKDMQGYSRLTPSKDRVDELVISMAPAGSRFLLDVGAGDGRRAARIAQAANLTEVVLVEPSLAMQRCGAGRSFPPLRAEQLDSLRGSFDVIVCLWNVLGHIFPRSARAEVLRQFARLVSPRGRTFVDVNHRYNSAQYGAMRTGWRFLVDRVRPSEKNGDVFATWNGFMPFGIFCHDPALARWPCKGPRRLP